MLRASGLADGFRIVHGIDFGGIARIDGIAAQFAVGCEQAVFRRESVADNREFPNLAVMRELRIHGIESGLNGCRFDRASHERTEVAAAIANDYDLLHRGKKAGELFLDGLGRNVMA